MNTLRLLLGSLLILGAVTVGADTPKTVILGFDGADADLAAQWMGEGKLPHVAKLREEGTCAPLQSTIPSQTPVSWSTFATGLKPGRHGIFDFLRRNVDTYTPEIALVEQSKVPFLWGERTPAILGVIAFAVLFLIMFALLKVFRLTTPKASLIGAVLALIAGVALAQAAGTLLPKDVPHARNPRQGDTFWEILGAAGHRVKVVRLPQNFPPKAFDHGTIHSGLGTPDLSGRIGKPFYFTSELFFVPPGGGDFSVEVVELVDNRGRIETVVEDPPNELFPGEDGKVSKVSIPMVLTVAEDRSSLDIEVSGQQFTLRPGEWSDWIRFTFPFNSIIKIDGIGRFRLLELEKEVRLYLSPIQFDPRKLPAILDISSPREYAGELAERHGPYKTIGWAIDTWSLDEGTIDEGVFMEDVENTVSQLEDILYGELGRSQDWDMLVHYFEFTDRVQHMMFRYFDPLHPLYTEEMGEKWGGTVLESYQRLDQIVGEVMERMPEDAHLFVVSDHGFSSFRRAMNYNTWLAVNGFMTLKGEDSERKNLEDLFDGGIFFENVDWSQTKAYALGLGNIYVNVKGREAQGIVEPGEEYEAVRQAIIEGLEAFVDEETEEHPVAHVWTREEAHGVFDPLLIPDLIPSNNDGYRVGWQDTLGNTGKTIVEPNLKVWSGDHCSLFPPLVEGIFFSNIAGLRQDPYMGDVMPTLLELYDVELPEGIDGRTMMVDLK